MVFAIVPHAAANVRLFSSLGLTKTKTRNRMAPATLSMTAPQPACEGPQSSSTAKGPQHLGRRSVEEGSRSFQGEEDGGIEIVKEMRRSRLLSASPGAEAADLDEVCHEEIPAADQVTNEERRFMEDLFGVNPYEQVMKGMGDGEGEGDSAGAPSVGAEGDDNEMWSVDEIMTTAQ
ncbi:hypothetical protein PsorP6_017980 [Peronosclerospora sorghi]|uniref:Uncharacterized protein n=1 Tax=Peronosclerospora sorghi TaxID=230839 RepID=A0ACC0WEL5_9STRA|nr:hypothetical protein PsorP6_017980 [Peronosclerospora sorghi]